MRLARRKILVGKRLEVCSIVGEEGRMLAYSIRKLRCVIVLNVPCFLRGRCNKPRARDRRSTRPHPHPDRAR